MFKRWIVCILIFSIMAALAQFTLPYLWYYSNYEYVSTELCIYKHRTDQQCDIQCQVYKRVQEQYDRDHDHSEQMVENEQKINLFMTSTFTLIAALKPLYPLTVEGTTIESLWIREPS